MSRGFVEICDMLNTQHNLVNGKPETVILWSAGRICGCGRFGYVIYGDPTRASLERKLYQRGYKFDTTLTLEELTTPAGGKGESHGGKPSYQGHRQGANATAEDCSGTAGDYPETACN